MLSMFSHPCHCLWKKYTFLAHLRAEGSQGELFWSLSVRRVRRPSVNNFFKHLLLLYYLAKSNQTSQECSLHGPLQNSFKEINSMQNSGCHGNQKEKLKKSSSPKWLNGFHCNLVWMFLGWTSFRFLEEILIRQKTWPPWAGLIFTI